MNLTDVLARIVFSGAPQDVLVMGCGVGRFAEQLSSMGHHVWACQESLPLTLQLQKWANEQGSEVDFFTADPLHVQPFSDGFFDVVIIEEEIGCSEDIMALFEEACRVTISGGVVAGTHLLREYSPRRQRRNFSGKALRQFVTEIAGNQQLEVRQLETGYVFWLSPGGPYG